MTQVWPAWESAVINGVYPLRRLLYGSDYSAVFLTEGRTSGEADAAIKIVPIERVQADLQLHHWRTAASLSHPYLIRLFDAGRCQLGGHQFLFVVMEYAEQTLAQVLPHRALTSDEAREMLLPTLDALGFLHRKNLVHGQLKPANFLVVKDQLKLASDAVRPAGEPRASHGRSSLYDAPEADRGRLTPAGDIWGLGITMVEALTQCLPWPDGRPGGVGLPATLPSAFVDTIRRCLSADPASRPTASDLEVLFRRAPQASPAVSAPQAVVRAARAAPDRAAPPWRSPRQGPSVPAMVAAALLTLSLAVWAGLHLLHSHANSQQPGSSTAETSSQPTTGGPVAASQNPERSQPASAKASALSTRRTTKAAEPLADNSPSVVHAQMPTVSPGALRTIHGHIKVAVLVTVDRSGNVSDALLENPGPSSYFAHLAKEAARKWKFAPADAQDSREWLVRFEFTRGGTTGHATTRS